MKILVASFHHREPSDILVVPFWEGNLEEGKMNLRTIFATGDFKGKQAETAMVYPEGDKEPRLLLLGLGKEEKGTLESVRRAYGVAARAAQAKKAKSANILLPHTSRWQREELIGAVSEGILFANYAFVELKGEKKDPITLLEKVTFLDLEQKDLARIERAKIIASGLYFIRDWVNRNADDKSPQVLAKAALGLDRVQTTILDKKKIEEEKLGLLLAVNRGSVDGPCLILSSYQGNPGSDDHVVLVGKGIVYDTGGLSIKTGDGMLTMKCDMAGAATVLGVVKTAAALGLKVNVTAVAPVTENSVDGKSYKPGDVYRAHNGKTVEITSTDAEGRLVLADAMSYALKHLKPTCMIDLATLTGAIVVALGEEFCGLFTSDETLSEKLLSSANKTGELLWRMPIHADYRDSLKSDYADLYNTGGRDAGAIKAALFLQEFVSQIPWAHMDIAGPAFLSKPKHYNTTKATGYGLRLLIDFLEQRSGH